MGFWLTGLRVRTKRSPNTIEVAKVYVHCTYIRTLYVYYIRTT